MALTIGTQVGSYEITALLGKGGMGEVYRARDTRFDRDVAIKTLPEEFETENRLARFERESKVLASLNHPNIGAIYGLEEHDARHFLVLELVKGETLADLIARGPIPVDESLKLAQQIAEALEAAHEKGVIHRDLKPANIKITPDGTVKVLDFGLAKADDAGFSGIEALSNSPTLRTLASSPGMILGTAAYMSPEQAKGRPVDRRTDIFAFGCVFYEMLTGRRAFDGEDVSDTLAAVLRAEADWSALPEDAPPGLRTLIQRCLAKDRMKRFAEISFVKFLLSEPAFIGSADGSGIASAAARSRPRLNTTLIIAASLLLIAVVAGALVWTLRPQLPQAIVKFSIALPEDQTFSNGRYTTVAISPDGTQLVYAANSRLYRRALSDLESKIIPGSESKEAVLNPTFSPDGRSIVFWSEQTIKRIAVDGGTPVNIARLAAAGTSITWRREGIVVGQGMGGIFRVLPDGGTPERIVSTDGEGAFEPQLLPGGKSVLFTLAPGGGERWDDAKIVVQSLMTGNRKTLVEGTGGRYLPTGHLVYAVGGNLLAVPFDLQQEKITGEAVPVLEGVRRLTATGGTQWGVSNNGTLVYIPGPAAFSGKLRSLIITDRNGSTMRIPLPAGPYASPRVSREGKHIAVAIDNGQDASIATYDLSTATALSRLTFEGHNRFPVWSGDSQWIAFQSHREGDVGIFMQRADGSSSRGERLTKPEPGVSHIPESWSPDGRTLLFSRKKDRDFSLWTLSLDTRKIMPFGNLQSRSPFGATFSPDGRWVAYTLQKPGTGSRGPDSGVYVEPFPPTGSRYQLPKEYFDFHPAWGTTSAELFYIPTASRLSMISVITHPTFTFGRAVSLPRPPTRDRIGSDIRDYDVMPDGRFLSSVPGGDETVSGSDAAPQMHVILNWLEELKQRVPVQ
jgi:eukaryotic-like serine/threonine-protein kinase